MQRTKCIAFHSYKGGTGKTTIASNCAAVLAKKGYKVGLLDMDVYAPSLLSYFDRKPTKWLNEYLIGSATIDEVMIDVTSTLSEYCSKNNNSTINGKLLIGFCNTKKEDVYKLDSASPENSKAQLRRFIVLRDNLIRDYKLDYLIIDTSPGIRYWSLNALVVADALLLTLKAGEIDIEGTKSLATEIYASLVKYGTKSFLLFNRVAGYCTPPSYGSQPGRSTQNMGAEGQVTLPHVIELENIGFDNFVQTLSSETKMEVISTIPCYCDIQFSKKEFLTVLQHPHHPFTTQIENMISAIERKV